MKEICEINPSLLLEALNEETGTEKIFEGVPNSQFSTEGAGSGETPARLNLGKSEAAPHSYPFMAALINSASKQQVCGGTLIDERHVLTSAQCLNYFKSFSDMVVALGAHNLAQNEKERQDHIVVSAVKQWGFFPYMSDIAVLKLKSPVTFNENIQPIRLDFDARKNGKKEAVIAGWGTASAEGHGSSTVLKHARVPVVTSRECTKAYAHMGKSMPYISEGSICGGKPELQVSKGDFGGPLFVKTGDGYEQIGIMSWYGHCFSVPVVHTRISGYIEWISRSVSLKEPKEASG